MRFTFLSIFLLLLVSCREEANNVTPEDKPKEKRRTYRAEYNENPNPEKLKEELGSIDTSGLEGFFEKNSGKIKAHAYYKTHKYESKFPEIQTKEYWELTNQIEGDSLYFKRIDKKSEAESNNFIFIFHPNQLFQIAERMKENNELERRGIQQVYWRESNGIVDFVIVNQRKNNQGTILGGKYTKIKINESNFTLIKIINEK